MQTHMASPQSLGSAAVQPGSGIRHILLSLDFSAHSHKCVEQAAFMARACDSGLTLLHVMQPQQQQAGMHATDALGWEIARQQASVTLERFEKEAREASGRPVDSRLEQGRPAERITAIAREVGADLVVLGNHGDGTATAINLGSTAQEVLALTQVSVLIARSAEDTGDTSGAFVPRRILMPLDGSPRTESTLPTVARMARQSGAEVLLLHVVSDPRPTEVLRTGEDLDLARELATRLEVQARQYLSRIQEQLARDLPSVRTIVLRSGDQPQSILELSRSEHVDLVVLSAHGVTCNRERSFGSITTYLVAHSPVPVVVLQDLTLADLHGPGNGPEWAPRPPSVHPRASA
jgi:nucleotide-binding universal stress UspA family protein